MVKITEAIDENNKMKEDAHLVIDQAFQALHKALELRKGTLSSKLESISLSNTTALTLGKEKYEKIEVASRIILTHTDDEIAALGGLIQTELNNLLKKVEPISVLANTHSDISVNVETDDLISKLSEFGCISDSSLSLSSSTWTSTSVAKVKSGFHVKIESKTSKGTVYPLQMKAYMTSKNGAVVHGQVSDHGDGTYNTTLIPLTAGPHQLLITLNGQHIQNSPHNLDVLGNNYNYNSLSMKQAIKCPCAPFGISITDNGDLFVAAAKGSICVFDSKGVPKKIGTDRKSSNILFLHDKECLTDGGDHFSMVIKENVLYVADKGTNCITLLTLEGTTIKKLPAKSAAGIVVDEYYRMFVSDCSGNKIDVLNHNGEKIFTIDGNVTGDRSFQSPYGLAFDPLGNIHVAAYGSNTIKVFTKKGFYIRKYGDLKGPRGIAIDSKGYSFVIECEGNCISIFDPQGNKIHTVGGLNKAFGLALDFKTTDTRLYVTDYDAHVVLMYAV